MKKVFDLIPKTGNDINTLHVLAEIGWYGVTFAWFKKDPLFLEGILSYNFKENILPEEIASNIENIFEKESIFDVANASASIYYNFKESLLVPNEFYKDEHSSSQLNTVFGIIDESFAKTDSIQMSNSMGHEGIVYNIYRVPDVIRSVFTQKFSETAESHSSSSQVQYKGDSKIQCIIFHNLIKVILFSRDQFQMIQQFNYNSPDDVVYHLMNICVQHEISPNDISLVLSGMIDAQSNLYNELYKYFLKINFESAEKHMSLPPHISEFPDHFFTHITALAKCAS